jgi:type VII secretion protein EccB
MATRTDQLQSYQFMTQRVISALVMRETDPRQSPLRRGIGAVFGGLMIAILVGAGFGVYGILTKVGSDEWKTSGSVVIEKESGASFVYVDGVLHPTLNFASAMLAAGRPNPAVFRVASNSLGAVPRGVIVGIAGAPNSLPPAAKQVGLPWTLCNLPGTDASGKANSKVALAVSRAPTGGQRLTDEGILAEDTKQGKTYLIWHGQRHRLQSAADVVLALFGAVTPVPVSTAFLNSLAAGVDVGPTELVGRTTKSPAVAGRTIGDVLLAQTGSGPQYYLVFDDGIAPITPLRKDMLAINGPVKPIPVSLTLINKTPRTHRMAVPSGAVLPPDATPKLAAVGRGDAICTVVNDAKSTPTMWVGGTVEGLDTAPPTRSVSADGAPLADRVLVPGGRVAVVRVLSAPTAESGTYFVVTDVGVKYPVSAAAVLPMLGYSTAQAVDVPTSLANRIPTGPTLDPAVAIKPAQVSGVAG